MWSASHLGAHLSGGAPPPQFGTVSCNQRTGPFCMSIDWEVYCQVTFTGDFGSLYELYVERRVNRGSWVHDVTVVPGSSPWVGNDYSSGLWSGMADNGKAGPAPDGYAQYRATIRGVGGGPVEDGPDSSNELSQLNWNYCME